MDLTIRDWMVIIGVLLITAVLLDAWRRVRNERRPGVKVKLAPSEDTGTEPDAELAWLKELPNGGARVIERGDLLRAAGLVPTANAPRSEQPNETAEPDSAARNKTAQPPSDDVELVAGMSSTGSDDDLGNIDWLDGMGAGDAGAA
jgi:cell division protein ZipA